MAKLHAFFEACPQGEHERMNEAFKGKFEAPIQQRDWSDKSPDGPRKAPPPAADPEERMHHKAKAARA